MSYSDPLPHAPSDALMGLQAAAARLDEATGKLLCGGGGAPIWIALSEALYWTATIDEQLQSKDRGYRQLRDKDSAGRAVGGLIFARNFHAHEMASAGGAEFEVPAPTIIMTPPGAPLPPAGRGPLFAVHFRWIAIEEL